MCYNVSYLEQKQAKLNQRYEKITNLINTKSTLELNLPLYYFVSGFSHPLLPIVKQEGIELYHWGLIPRWTKDSKGVLDIHDRTLNAVGETVFEKPSFRSCIGHQRCLLPINGFYEWRDINKIKYPYFIKIKGNPIFSLGCIYETWVDKQTAEIHNTFSILTTPANAFMEKIHNLKKRMPLIISIQDEEKWVDPKLDSKEIKELIKPYSDADMVAYTISKKASNAKFKRNVPEILEEVIYPELT